MTVDDQRRRLVGKNPPVERDILFVIIECRGVLQIALMLRQDGLPVLGETERRFQLAAHRQQLWRRFESGRQFDPAWGETARAAQRARSTADEAHDRIVDAVGDPAAMNERAVGDPGELLARLRVVDNRRLMRDVGAGHHQRPVHVLQQQSMQRRGRQHETERAEPGRNRARQSLRTVSVEQNDRPLDRGELALLRCADRAIAADDIEVAGHERERLGFPPLALPQPLHCIGIFSVAGEVIASDTLDRHDSAAGNECGGERDGVEAAVICRRRRRQRKQGRRRPAMRAGDRFGMKAAIVRIVILGAAVWAERESCHRRIRPVIGNCRDDAQPRAAMGAACERVAVMTIGRVA